MAQVNEGKAAHGIICKESSLKPLAVLSFLRVLAKCIKHFGFGLPKELGLKGALFADAGTLYGFSDKTDFSGLLGYSYCPAAGSIPITQPSCLRVDDERMIRSSLGVSVLWASPIGPLRFDLAYPVLKGKYDQTQYFNFSGGATF